MIEDAKTGAPADDPKLKTFLVCVAKKISFVDENGEINHTVVKSKLGDGADKLDADCAVKKATVEDTVFDSLKCYYAKTGKSLLIH